MDLNGFRSSFDLESLSSFRPEGDFQFYKEKATPGFHFVATTTVMVLYLVLKEQGLPLANIFQEVPLYDYNPDQLQRKFNKGKGDELYLYTKIKSLKNGGRVERKAGSGRWKNLNREEITQGDRTIAYKTTLTYYVVKDGKEERTCWSMHEYRLHRKKSERKMRDEVVLCKIYKQGGAGKTSEAIDEESPEETGGSIGSCNYLQPSAVSNGLGQSFPDGSSDLPMAAGNDPLQSAVSPVKDSVTPMNIVYGGFPMADVNDRFQFEQSRIEDSVTPMNIVYGGFPMADVNDRFQFEQSRIEDSVTHMNDYADFSILADVDDPFQFALPPPIEHLATLMNGWGVITMDDVVSNDLWNS